MPTRRSEAWAKPGIEKTIGRELKALGARTRQLRKNRDLTQEEAAEIIGVHPVTLSRIELGRLNVAFGTIVAIARAFQVDLKSLF